MKKLIIQGTTIRYRRPPLKMESNISVLVLANASRSDENGKIRLSTALLLRNISEESKYHILSYISHKLRRPVKSISGAENLAEAEGIEEGEDLTFLYSALFGTKAHKNIC